MTDTIRDLANLAYEAAIELDNYNLGRDCNELAAVAKLGEWLTENVPTRDTLFKPHGFFGDPFLVINELAKRYATDLGPDVYHLCDWVHRQVARLKAESTTNPAYWRGWCLSLSQIASAESSYRRRR